MGGLFQFFQSHPTLDILAVLIFGFLFDCACSANKRASSNGVKDSEASWWVLITSLVFFPALIVLALTKLNDEVDKLNSPAAAPAPGSVDWTKLKDFTAQQPPAQAAPTLEDFKQFAGRYADYLHGMFAQAYKSDSATIGLECSAVRTDMVRTDSAIHPVVFEAIFNMRIARLDNSMTAIEEEQRIDFIHDHGWWEPVGNYMKMLVNIADPQSATGVERSMAVDPSVARAVQGLSN